MGAHGAFLAFSTNRRRKGGEHMSKKKPDATVPGSGIYRNQTTGDRVTVNRGDPFPPTPGPSQRYVPES
jgi:hypothetical protein